MCHSQSMARELATFKLNSCKVRKRRLEFKRYVIWRLRRPIYYPYELNRIKVMHNIVDKMRVQLAGIITSDCRKGIEMSSPWPESPNKKRNINYRLACACYAHFLSLSLWLLLKSKSHLAIIFSCRQVGLKTTWKPKPALGWKAIQVSKYT